MPPLNDYPIRADGYWTPYYDIATTANRYIATTGTTANGIAVNPDNYVVDRMPSCVTTFNTVTPDELNEFKENLIENLLKILKTHIAFDISDEEIKKILLEG